MARISREFFSDNEVLFVGYSSRNERFCSDIMQAMMNAGLKVIPFNKKAGGTGQVKVFTSLDSIPKVPRTAYVLLSSENALKAVPELFDRGVRKMLFQNKRSATPAVLDECNKLGIETVIGCPMMVFGSGMHRFHGFLSGVKK